jgi:hypothetical protein
VNGEGRTPPSAWLALLVFADGFFVLLFALREISGWTVVGIVLAGLPLAGPLSRRPMALPWFAPAAGLLASFVLAVMQGYATNSAGDALLGGLLVGSPLIVMAAILRWSRDATVLLPITFAGLVDLLTLNAAVNRLASEHLVPTPPALATAFGQVTGDQAAGFGDLLVGSSSATLPVQVLGDPVFAGLALLAIVGVFLSLFAEEGGSSAGARPEPRAVFVPVGVAVVAAGLFEVAASGTPRFALLGVAVAVLATVVAILVLARPRSAAPSPPATGPVVPATPRTPKGKSTRFPATSVGRNDSAQPVGP